MLKLMKTFHQIVLISLIVIVLALGLEDISGSEQVNQNIIIGAIPEKDINYGCGCSYSSSSIGTNDQIIFISDIGFGKPIMNLNGQTIKLIPIDIEDIPKNPKIGDKFLQTYRYGKITMIFENIVNFICSPDDEGCEVIKFGSKLTVIDGLKKEVHQVQGDCGC